MSCHDKAAHSESHRTAGLLQCHRLLYQSRGFTREGNAQASALQDHHLWQMVLVFEQEVDSCRSCASCPAAAARLLTLLLNGGLGERQPETPYCRCPHALCTAVACALSSRRA
jgi:hypothetical protein